MMFLRASRIRGIPKLPFIFARTTHLVVVLFTLYLQYLLLVQSATRVRRTDKTLAGINAVQVQVVCLDFWIVHAVRAARI
jgi:hypothetical protein